MPPNLVIAFRHGEKPPNAEDEALPDDGDPGLDRNGEVSTRALTCRGWARAWALAGTLLYGRLPEGSTGENVAILVPDYGNDTRKHRPYLTVLPLAQRLRTEPLTPVDRDDVDGLCSNVMASRAETVVVCWEHDLLAAFASKLLVRGIAWPDDADGHGRYDPLWVIHLASPTSESTFDQLEQPFRTS